MATGDSAGTPPPPGGRVLVSTKGTAILGCGATLLVVAVGLIIVMGFSGGYVLIPSVIAIAAAIALGYGVKEMQKWEAFELVIPVWPVPLGATLDAELIRRAKTSVPDRDIAVRGLIICREKVTYQVGTDTRTERNDVCKQPFSTIATVNDGVFRAPIPLVVPLDRGGPTIDFEHNDITWRVDLEMEKLSWTSASQSFEFVVAPYLDTDAGVIQDAPRSQP